jgi:MFS family permease
MLGFGLIAPALPLFAASFGVSYTAVGLLISGFGVVRLVSQPFGGRLVDRLGERTVAVAGVLIVGVSSVAAGAARSFPELLVARSIGGIGSAWFITSLLAYVLGIVPKDGAGRALSYYQGSFTAGITMGPVAGGFLASQFGLRAPFLAYGVFCFAAGALALRTMRPVSDRPAVRHDVPRQRLPGDIRFVVAVMGNLVLWFAFAGSRITLVPLYAQQELGASEAWVGTALTVAAIASLVVLPHAGRAADRSRFGVLIPGLLVSGATIGFFGFIETQTAFLAVLAVLGAVQGYVRVPVSALVADVTDETNRGRAVAVHQMAGDVGSLVGPLSAGAIATRWGFATAFFAVALATVPAVAVVAVSAARHRSSGR